jgi:hypothetical protein
MKAWIMAVVVAALSAQGVEHPMAQMCPGAAHAAVAVVAAHPAAQQQEPPPDDQPQEAPKLPPGEWCQRAAAPMPKKAHACDCHRECSDTGDPARIIEDPKCTVYCRQSQCRCGLHGCP